jgi:hypothetical protein
MSLLVKCRFSLSGHRTFVALEAEFWDAWSAIAITEVMDTYGRPPRIRSRLLSAADLGDENDLAIRPQLRGVGILENLAIDGDRHAFLDLLPQPRETLIKFQNKPAKIGRRHLDLG